MKRSLRPWCICAALLSWCAHLGCANEIPTPLDEVDDSITIATRDMPQDQDAGVGADMNIGEVPDAPAEAVTWPAGLFGSPCEADDDCAAAPGGTCAHLLGEQAPGVCTVEDCLTNGCPVGGRCVTLGPTTACLPDEPDFCEVECGDALECALELECLDRGCCGSGSCPSICGQMSYSDCEMSARCAASCCTL